MSKRVKIYFIRAIGTNYVKVGFTASSVKRRMEQIDGNCPFDLKVYRWFYVTNKAFEFSLHKILTDMGYHVKKEWFSMTDDEIDSIYNLYKDSYL